MGKRELTRVEGGEYFSVHILPHGFLSHANTLCGETDVVGVKYKPTNKAVTCHMCQSEFDALKDGLKIVKF